MSNLTKLITNLKKLGGFASHAGVEVSFATLNVVMQISTELMDEVDCVVPVGWVGVTREKHKSHVPGKE